MKVIKVRGKKSAWGPVRREEVLEGKVHLGKGLGTSVKRRKVLRGWYKEKQQNHEENTKK